jgi:hypothetical protein
MSQVQQDQRREQLAKNYQLLRRLWREEKITWEGRFRPPLTRVTSQPTSTAKDAAAITEGTGQTHCQCSQRMGRASGNDPRAFARLQRPR